MSPSTPSSTALHNSPATVSIASSRPRRSVTPWLVAGLLLIFVLQCAWFIRTQSFTIDESDHIIAGLDAWSSGEFERWMDHPPLGRLWLTLPMLSTNWKYVNRDGDDPNQPNHGGSRIDQDLKNKAGADEFVGWHVDSVAVPVSPAPEVWLYRTRSMNVVLGVALLMLLFLLARRLFSEGAALFAVALAVVSPELIAHYSLATTDGAGALALFAMVVQLARWRRQRTLPQTLLLGLCVGLALISKFSTLPMCPLVMLLLLVSDTGARWGVAWNPRKWNWREAAQATVVVFLTVWAGYLFHVSKVVFHNGVVAIHLAGYTKLLTYPLPFYKNLTIYIPACEFLMGIGMQSMHYMEGHRAFFLGQVSTAGGWKAYFPVAIVVKWPIIILMLCIAGVIAFFARRRGSAPIAPGTLGSDLLFISIFPALYLLMAFNSTLDIGIRHLLPVYPFLLLYAAAAWEAARINSGKLRFALLLLLFLQTADILRYAPDYISYFNCYVPSRRSYELLSDSNVDWGEGLVALRNYQSQHPNETLHLAYFGSIDAAWYGIRYQPLQEGERATGTVIVSATHLSGQLLKDQNAYHWLLQYPLKTVLNHTLYVFEVPAR